MFDILRLPTTQEAQNLANRYEQEQEQALQSGDAARAEQWGARADAERYIAGSLQGKVAEGRLER
jgi:hypothetical protein